MVNRTSTPIRIKPGQVLALGEVILKIKPEDQDKWEPSNPEPDGPVQNKEDRIQTLYKELKLDEKELLIEDPNS